MTISVLLWLFAQKLFFEPWPTMEGHWYVWLPRKTHRKSLGLVLSNEKRKKMLGMGTGDVLVGNCPAFEVKLHRY
jgi:hypothetical protein